MTKLEECNFFPSLLLYSVFQSDTSAIAFFNGKHLSYELPKQMFTPE